jgi:radical SAM superfamily enzyme YgiQ (UPF0313 family)/8-oxo-dGTP pyrophosphatase MutT (NUDIX family)
MNREIILVNAKSVKEKGEKGRIYFPLKLLYFGTILKRAGYRPKIYDLIVEDKINYSQVKISPPLLVLISSTTKTLPSAIQVADAIKSIDSNIPVVLEGLHAIHFPEQVVRDESFDVALIGEGEKSVLFLAEAFSKGLGMEKVPGIVFEKNGEIIRNNSEPLFDLDELPLIDYGLVDMGRYLYRKIDFITGERSLKKVIRLSFSRGCLYNCPFCLYKSYSYRAMSFERCLKEIDYITEKFDPDILFFEDSCWFADKEKSVQLLETIRKNRKKYRFKIICTARANYFNRNYISPRFIERYKDIILIWDVGGETGNEEVLKKIEKKITLEDLERVARHCGKTGARAGFSFMTGMPGEKRKEMIETVKFMEKLKKLSGNNLLITYQFYQPLGKTRWSEEAVKLKWKRPRSLRDWEKQFDKKVGTISPVLLPWIKSIDLLEYLIILVKYYVNDHLRVSCRDKFVWAILSLSWNIRKFLNFFGSLWELKLIRLLGYEIFDRNFNKSDSSFPKENKFRILEDLKLPPFEKITSVAVVVFNNQKNILTVNLRERGIDLPGGHVEKNDSDIFETAKREVREEACTELEENLMLCAIIESRYTFPPTYMVVLAGKIKKLYPFRETNEVISRSFLKPQEFLERYRYDRRLMGRIVEKALETINDKNKKHKNN